MRQPDPFATLRVGSRVDRQRWRIRQLREQNQALAVRNRWLEDELLRMSRMLERRG